MTFTDDEIRSFRARLLQWYTCHARDLPWRNSDDPYHIWISEIMLQQTRVDQARPYFERFIHSYPTVNRLSEASLDEVLLNWEGLGYYSRARNLHKAARLIVQEYDGRLPEEYHLLLKIPGIGPYTASAIASIAFDKPLGVLDGNVIRVLTRLTCNNGLVSRTKIRRDLQRQSNELVDPNTPGDFNQALMELGAIRCLPAIPQCPSCPVRSFCCAYKTDAVDLFPVVGKKKPVPHFDMATGILRNAEGAFLIKRRPESEMLGGLWEFPATRKQTAELLEEACIRHFKDELGIRVAISKRLYSLSHAYSHFKITVHAFSCRLTEPDSLFSMQGNDLQWVLPDNLDEYAFHRAHRKLIDRIMISDRSHTLFDQDL